MHVAGEAEAEVSWCAADRGRPSCLAGEDEGQSPIKRAHVAADSDPDLLDRGWNLTDTAGAVGGYLREVRRVGSRYLERGLEAALNDEPRPKPAKMLDAKQQAAIVAMVCGPPPEGRSRWTIVLTAHETKRRGIVAKVGRETIRRLFASHELKPWREKNVVRAQARRGIRRPHGRGAGRLEPGGG